MSEKKQNHLPLFGVGPLYAGIVVLLTVAAYFCRNLSVLESGKLTGLRMPLKIAGILMIIAGAYIWIQAVVVSKVDDNILKNQLVTTGVYAWVRNPIYSAFMIICTGVLLMIGNLYFLFLPFVYWLFMTVLMKKTEEVWLEKQYGKEYTDYCARVNRCWPWLPKK